MHRKAVIIFAVALGLGAVVGCSGGDNDSTAQSADNTIQQDYTTSKNWAHREATQTGQAAEKFTHNASVAADNDATSLTVKSALLGAKDLTTSSLHVDSNGKSVTLSGSVPTESERERASQIAKGVLGSGYTVKNNLTIEGK